MGLLRLIGRSCSHLSGRAALDIREISLQHRSAAALCWLRHDGQWRAHTRRALRSDRQGTGGLLGLRNGANRHCICDCHQPYQHQSAFLHFLITPDSKRLEGREVIRGALLLWKKFTKQSSKKIASRIADNTAQFLADSTAPSHSASVWSLASLISNLWASYINSTRQNRQLRGTSRAANSPLALRRFDIALSAI